MIILDVRDFMQVLRDMGYPASSFISTFNEDMEYIQLYLFAYGITVKTNLNFLNVYGLKFDDEKAELVFKLRYRHLIDPRYQLL